MPFYLDENALSALGHLILAGFIAGVLWRTRQRFSATTWLAWTITIQAATYGLDLFALLMGVPALPGLSSLLRSFNWTLPAFYLFYLILLARTTISHSAGRGPGWRSGLRLASAGVRSARPFPGNHPLRIPVTISAKLMAGTLAVVVALVGTGAILILPGARAALGREWDARAEQIREQVQANSPGRAALGGIHRRCAGRAAGWGRWFGNMGASLTGLGLMRTHADHRFRCLSTPYALSLTFAPILPPRQVLRQLCVPLLDLLYRCCARGDVKSALSHDVRTAIRG